MLTRSTGLGNTELAGEIQTVDIKADYMIIGCKTTSPVKWHVRVAISYPDLITVLRLLLTSGRGWIFVLNQSLKTLMRPFQKDKSLMRRPDDF
jgi:hypothetical protein